MKVPLVACRVISSGVLDLLASFFQRLFYSTVIKKKKLPIT